MNALKALVFDLDGTLVDQEGSERDALQQLYERDFMLESKPAYGVFLRDWRNVADEYLQRFLDNKISFEAQRNGRFQLLFERYGSACSPEQAAEFGRKYQTYYEAQWRAFEDAAPTLIELKKKHRLAMITNGSSQYQRAKLKATGLDQYLEHVIASEDVKVAKPDPAIFRHMEKALGLGPSDLAYVGDRQDADVEGARAAGWTPIFLNRKGMPGITEPGLRVIYTLKDLLDQ